MLAHPERIHFKDEEQKAPRMIVLWFLLFVFLALISAGILLEGILHAQERGDEHGVRPSEATSGTLLYRTDEHPYLPAPLLKTDVEMEVSGLIVRATVRQQFKNESSEWAEGVYVFPLPEHAAVDHLTMRIGERIIEGVIQERAEAKKRYERTKTEGKRASLIEQERPNLFNASVANIGPGDEITIEIQYQQTLHYDQGQFRLRLPLAVGVRYIPGVPDVRERAITAFDGHGWARNTDQVPDASRITPPVERPDRGPLNPVSLKIDLAPGFTLARLESLSHPIQITQMPAERYRITLQEGAVPADRDFELMWQPAIGAAPAAAVFTEQKDDAIFTLFMIMPPQLSAGHESRVPREAVFVIDTSGSMHGHSIDQAKSALALALARLTPDDTFNVIQFNSMTQSLFSDPMPATKANIAKAVRYVADLCANGGTEMLPALQRALDGREQHAKLRQVIFLTDGQVGNEEALFQTIRQYLGDSRLFTIGIGSAPNSHFMTKAAEFGRGTFTYIGSTTEVQAKMDALYRKLDHPALTDIHIDLPSSPHAEIFPSRLPDLYLGEPLWIAIKADSPFERAIIRGRFEEKPWEVKLPLQDSQGREGVSVFWAREKINSLMNQRQEGAEDDLIRKTVVDLAMKHHLVSRYTSLVAVDVTPARPNDKDLYPHALKTNLPHGWDYTHVLGLPQTATAGPLHLLMGLLLLACALAAFGLRNVPWGVNSSPDR